MKKNLMFEKNYVGEVNKDASVTKQGQATSIQEVLKRFGYTRPDDEDYEFDSRVDGSDLEATDFDGDLDDPLIDISEAVNQSIEVNQNQNQKVKEGSTVKDGEQTSQQNADALAKN